MEIQSKGKKLGGALFIGCMFIGIGIGMYFDKTSIGTLIGMGVGYIASAIAKSQV